MKDKQLRDKLFGRRNNRCLNVDTRDKSTLMGQAFDRIEGLERALSELMIYLAVGYEIDDEGIPRIWRTKKSRKK